MSNLLSEVHPELVLEWSERNLPLTPDKITYGSNKIVWWIGTCGHEWQTSVKARSSGEKCPICSGARAVEGINDLVTLKPELAAEWSSKNNPLKPTMVTVGSHKKVIWKGKCGHEWTATVKSRAISGTGCPYCSHNKVLEGFNDLASQRPLIASEWSERNYPLKPNMVTVFANRKVWWKCSKGHEWNTLISTRSGGSQCPYCSGQILLKGFNDFATTHPQLAQEWSDRNLPLTPDMINEKSRKNVWWKCRECGNEWQSVVYARIRGTICPVCADRAVMAGYNDLATTDAHLLSEWDYEKNTVSPDKVSCGSNKKVWWKCQKCGNSWQAAPYTRTKLGSGCPYCFGRLPIKGKTDLASQKPELLKDWDYEKNEISPDDICCGSEKKVWWKCHICGYEWQASPSLRNAGGGCTKCLRKKAGKKKSLEAAKTNSLSEKYPQISEEWDYEKNDTSPDKVSCGSNKRVWWICHKCGYGWQATPNTRTSGCGCPCCAGRVVVPGINDLASKKPELLKDWNYEKNTVSPKEVTCGSHKKVWWKCHKCGYEWQTTPHNRTGNNRTGCPKCSRTHRSETQK